MRFSKLLLITVLSAVPIESFAQEQSVTESERFDLICAGDGIAKKSKTDSVVVTDQNGNQTRGNVTKKTAVPFQDQVRLWIENDDGRIRMPRAMLPPLRGGEDGWFKIKKIEIGENEITGKVAINAFNNPNLRIDRITGAINISGRAGEYSGICEPYDPENVEKAF